MTGLFGVDLSGGSSGGIGSPRSIVGGCKSFGLNSLAPGTALGGGSGAGFKAGGEIDGVDGLLLGGEAGFAGDVGLAGALLDGPAGPISSEGAGEGADLPESEGVAGLALDGLLPALPRGTKKSEPIPSLGDGED